MAASPRPTTSRGDRLPRRPRIECFVNGVALRSTAAGRLTRAGRACSPQALTATTLAAISHQAATVTPPTPPARRRGTEWAAPSGGHRGPRGRTTARRTRRRRLLETRAPKSRARANAASTSGTRTLTSCVTTLRLARLIATDVGDDDGHRPFNAELTACASPMRTAPRSRTPIQPRTAARSRDRSARRHRGRRAERFVSTIGSPRRSALSMWTSWCMRRRRRSPCLPLICPSAMHDVVQPRSSRDRLEPANEALPSRLSRRRPCARARRGMARRRAS